MGTASGSGSGALAPYACAAANAVAALALAVWIAPGTELASDPATYVRTHALQWRIAWATWMVAGVSLVLFYRWLAVRARSRGVAAVALAIATLGLAVDLVGESALILLVPDVSYEFAHPALYLSGGGANGLYSLAGALLTVAVPLRGRLAATAWLIWTSGAVVSVAALASLAGPSAEALVRWPLVAAGASAMLFALLVPWCVAVGRLR